MSDKIIDLRSDSKRNQSAKFFIVCREVNKPDGKSMVIKGISTVEIEAVEMCKHKNDMVLPSTAKRGDSYYPMRD